MRRAHEIHAPEIRSRQIRRRADAVPVEAAMATETRGCAPLGPGPASQAGIHQWTSSHGALLVAAGIAGGIIAAIVGGAAVIIFPALLAAGLPPVMATAANTAALTPGLFLAAIYDRSQLPPFDRSFVAVALASIVGALIGAVLLLLTPERMFAALVPLLLGFATVLFAYAGRISTWLAARAATRGNARRFTHSPGGGAAGLGLWRLFRRRRRGAHARRAFGRDRRRTIAPPTSPRTWCPA